jgi:hypothetical protein
MSGVWTPRDLEIVETLACKVRLLALEADRRRLVARRRHRSGPSAVACSGWLPAGC